MDRSLLSIDCGTQSLRAMIFTPTGSLLAREQICYAPSHSPRPGWNEKEAAEYWDALKSALWGLKAQAPSAFKSIEAMGLTTIRDTVLCLDRDGNPLRPAILWMDQRKADPVYAPGWLQRFGARLVGMDEAVERIQLEGKGNWLKQHEPEIWRRTRTFALLSTWLNLKLTGVLLDSSASQIGHIPFNYKKRRWSRRGELTARLFPVEQAKLAPVVEPGSILGHVTREAASETGLPEGLPVIACGSDKGCETLGAGVIDLSQAALSFGTTATIQSTSQRYFEPISYMPAYPSPVPGHYNPSVEIFRGFWMVSWFKNEFAQEEVAAATREGVSPEELMNRWLHEIPPGSLGLIVQPYWGGGLKEPSAKGAIIGFGDAHTKPHLYRAVLEGLGYALLDGLHRIERKGKTRVELCIASGGGSQSDEVCQMTADIFNRPVGRGSTFETAGLGAAIAVAVGAGAHGSFEEAVSKMTRVSETFSPNPRNAAIYSRLYEEVYCALYKSVKPLYERIREITGYPAPPPGS